MVLRFALVVAVVLGLVAPAPAQVVTLKLATIVGNDNPFTTSAYKFKEIAEAKSGGRIKVEVYPAGQLTKNEIVAIEGMQIGTVDIAAIVPALRGRQVRSRAPRSRRAVPLSEPRARVAGDGRPGRQGDAEVLRARSGPRASATAAASASAACSPTSARCSCPTT